MARKFLTALDLGKNELQNARIQNLATDPSSPVLGQIYFNTVANEMRIYNGTAFEAIGLNGVTADAAELNILDGATLTTTELNYVDGVTSAIQTQLNNKQAVVANVSDTEIGYLDGVTSGIQGQIDLKAPLANPTFTGTVTLDTGVNLVFEGTNANAFETTLTAGDPTADRTVTLPDSTTTLVGTDTTDTLTNKTLTSPTVTSPTVSGLYLSDGSIVFEGATADAFETTLQVTDPTADRTITLPDATDTLVGRATTDTLTNKTLTAPNVSGLTLTDGTIVVEGSTNDSFETTISFVDPTADQTIYVPNASGTLARVENKLHDFALATSSVDLNNQKITNLATPTAAGDATNKAYVDSAVAGLNWKQAVHLVATANVALTGSTNTLVIDGHSALDSTDDGIYRLLLTAQSTGTENGIYLYTDNGTNYTLVRTSDADTYQELIGASVFVMEGTVYDNTSWVQGNHYITDFSNQAWTQFSGASTATAGAGLVATGNVFSVGAGTGITVNANDVAIDTTVVVRKYAANIGDGSATSYTITHNLGTRDVTVGLYEPAASYAEVVADVEHSTTNTITVKFTVAPTTDQFRVVVHG
jgi:hypothetical protein